MPERDFQEWEEYDARFPDDSPLLREAPPAQEFGGASPAEASESPFLTAHFEGEAEATPTTLHMRPEEGIQARILWPALGFPAVVAPQANGSSDPFATDPSRSLCALILSNRKYLSKEDAARYLRVVAWSERDRRTIPAGQAGSFSAEEVQVRNDDAGGNQKLAWPEKDDHCDAVVFGGSGGEKENPIAVSLARGVREFYKKAGLGYLHEIRISEAATARLAGGQYHLFWNNEGGRAHEPSDEMKLLIEGFARPRREALGAKWAAQLESFVDEYKIDYGARHSPYRESDPQERLTEVLHPVFIRRQSGPLRIGHITDAHVHVRADVYENNLRKAGKLAGVSFNNFNRNFAEIYREVKDQSDVLLLTGDLIDYARGHAGTAFSDTLGQDDAYHKDRNWILFYYLLASGGNYSRPAYTILGNHDWRLNPYPPFAPGAPELAAYFNNAGDFNAGQVTELMKTAHGPGHERLFAYSLDAESKLGLLKHPKVVGQVLAGNFNLAGSPLQTTVESVMWYLLLINPFLDYRVKFPGGQQLLMLDWAEDEQIEDLNDRTWLGAGPRAAKSLTPLQKWHVEDFADLPGSAKIIGIHAPPIGPYPEWPGPDIEKGIRTYRPGEDSRLRGADGKNVKVSTHTMFAIRPAGQPFGVAADYASIARERDWFIRKVADPRTGVRLILSGHIHRNGLFAVFAPTQDPGVLAIRNIRYAGVRGLGAAGPLYVNTTSAGPRGFQWDDASNYVPPGYALMGLAKDGTIDGVSVRQLVPAPASKAKTDVQKETPAFEFDPYASIRSALSPEHADLTADEVTLVLGSTPANVALHQLLNSPEMRQAALASLLGNAARQSVRVGGSDVSIPVYLRMASRLCREVAEQSEASVGGRDAGV